jgi:endonuclease III
MTQLSLFPDQPDKGEQTRVREIFRRLQAASVDWEPTSLSHFKGEPFKALVAGMLSAQTREEQTLAASRALFALADNPADMLKLSDEQIFEAIQVVSYARSKVPYARDIAEKVAANDGVVPDTLDELTQMKGVGWKVAAVTLNVGFGYTDDIAVDVHVFRIGQRMGLVDLSIKQPPKAGEALKKVLPRDIWQYWNALMVRFGRTVCQPTYPRCDACPVNDLCPKIGVQPRNKEKRF